MDALKSIAAALDWGLDLVIDHPVPAFIIMVFLIALHIVR